jgi:hypothetical protein
MTKKQDQPIPELPFMFGDNFLDDHAGHIVNDPKVAIIELIANAYDAGAKNVQILWPAQDKDVFKIADDGTGMSADEFERRWKTWSYNRVKEQGEDVTFPPGVRSNSRIAFGRNGKGRHAAFCFGDEYFVRTYKDGEQVRFRVVRNRTVSEPFLCQQVEISKKDGHGTELEVVVERNLISQESVIELIGSKFLVDPSFEVKVNKHKVTLIDLKNLITKTLIVKDVGEIEVHYFDSELYNKTIKFKGIAWWVNKRMVGSPSWGGLDGEGAYLDGRTNLAKRYSFIVSADILKPEVKADWTGFNASAKFNKVRDAVDAHVISILNGLMASTRKEKKTETIRHNRELIGNLSSVSRHIVGEFIDQVQEKCPTISEKDLQRVVEVMGTMEKSRSGLEILQQLEKCSPEDIDSWNEIMKQWTAKEASIVLGELDRRLKLIKQLESLVDSKSTDELHDLQPLFEQGLWMFGPEFEAIEFRSNRQLATVIRELLGGTKEAVKGTRPDFVCLPDCSLGTYSTFSYESTGGEVAGVDRVLVIELKKGGFKLTQKELDQARDYAKELRKGDGVTTVTKIDAYVLGSAFEQGLDYSKYGEATKVVPMTYGTLLQRAHSRTFNLQKRINESMPVIKDKEIEDVLSSPVQVDLIS